MDISNATCSFLLAQANVPGAHESYLEAIYRLVGPVEFLLILSTGLAVFIGACLVVTKCRQPSTIASWLVLLPLPLIVSIYGLLASQIQSLIALSLSPAVQPSASQIAAGVAAALSPLFLGITVTFPSYLILAIGLVFRTFKARARPIE